MIIAAHKKRLFLMLALCYLGGMPGVFAQQSNMQVNIARTLDHYDLKANQVRASFTVKSDTEAPWFRGYTGNIALKWLSIKPLDQKLTPANAGLKVALGSGIPTVKKCLPFINCETAEAHTKGQKTTIKTGTGDWQIQQFGSPCLSGKCEMFLPSWALSRHAGAITGIQKFPSYLTIMQFQDRLIFVDTIHSRVFLSFLTSDSMELRSIGLLNEVYFNEQGYLVANFSEGAIQFDFARDQTLLINSNGLFIAKNGIANFHTALTPLIYLNDAERSNFIAYKGSIAVWKNGFVNLRGHKLSGDSNFKFTEVINIQSATRLEKGLLVLHGNNNSLMVSQVGNNGITKEYDVDTTVLAKHPNHKFVFFGESLAILSTTGTLLYRPNGTLINTSLNFGSDLYKILDQGQVLVNETTDSSCEWKHLRQNTKRQESFVESGLKSPCGFQQGFTADRSGIISTINNGRLLEVQVFDFK